jgi:hypothetical protein
MVFALDPTTKRQVVTVHQGHVVQLKVDARQGVK